MTPKLADGGIIPPGFNNDTFPALLSSNEAIIPLDRLKFEQNNERREKEVVFRIGQDELYGIMKKKTKRTSIY